MLRKLLNKEGGFTLIEIVLVLAIAGLIFVIVFLGVSGAQRARRDTARKADADRFLAAAEQYAGNNNGDYPTVVAHLDTYVTNATDPSTGAAYTKTYGTLTTGYDSAGEIEFSRSANCVGNVLTAISPVQNRKFAVAVYQEAGGSYCIDND
jgi:prepilin-type N-terminal cleavage/methylation domain-containing protein